MASIGPQLPPHLTKRKRTPEDDRDATKTQPPSKTSRRANDNEIDLDDSSSGDDDDDDFGPSAPSAALSAPNALSTDRPRKATTTALGPSLPSTRPRPSPPRSSRPVAGPTLPPSETNRKNASEIAIDDPDDSDDAGPAPAPSSAPARRVLGPTAPPAPLSERPTTGPGPDPGADLDADSDSDSDYGPALPTSAEAQLGAEQTTQSPSTTSPSRLRGGRRDRPSPSSSSTAPKRDDWMLIPPPPTTSREPDPTALKARKFASGRAAGAPNQSGEIGSLWTESAAERRQRVLTLGGADDQSAHQSQQAKHQAQPKPGAAAASTTTDSRKTAADQAAIRAYTEQTRGKSLYAEHQAARKNKDSAASSSSTSKREEEDDPSKRAFDKEKDMAIGGRITGGQRREMLRQAADFGGRFQKGKFL